MQKKMNLIKFDSHSLLKFPGNQKYKDIFKADKSHLQKTYSHIPSSKTENFPLHTRKVYPLMTIVEEFLASTNRQEKQIRGLHIEKEKILSLCTVNKIIENPKGQQKKNIST